MNDLVLYGVPLTLIVVGVVKLLRDEANLSEKAAKYGTAIGVAVSYLLIQFAPNIESMWPAFPIVVPVVGGAIGLFLSVLGYWPEAQKLGSGTVNRLNS